MGFTSTIEIANGLKILVIFNVLKTNFGHNHQYQYLVCT